MDFKSEKGSVTGCTVPDIPADRRVLSGSRRVGPLRQPAPKRALGPTHGCVSDQARYKPCDRAGGKAPRRPFAKRGEATTRALQQGGGLSVGGWKGKAHPKAGSCLDPSRSGAFVAQPAAFGGYVAACPVSGRIRLRPATPMRQVDSVIPRRRSAGSFARVPAQYRSLARRMMPRPPPVSGDPLAVPVSPTMRRELGLFELKAGPLSARKRDLGAVCNRPPM